MPARRKQPVAPAPEEPCGSGQSASSLARDKAAQPRLLAAAAARKAGVGSPAKIIGTKAIDKHGKKLIDLSSLRSPSSSASSSKAHKVAKAVFSLVKATYQKGEKKGELSGAIYFRGKPRYANNQKFKDKVVAKLLAESLRWNDEFKLYSAKVYTAVQAGKILEAMRMVSAEDEKDLEDVTIDDIIFANANPAQVTIFPIEVDGKLNTAIAGSTYPFKKILTDAGFTFHNTVNGEHGVQLWLREDPEAQPEVDVADLTAMFEEYGFVVDTYDGVAEDACEDKDM